MNRVERRAVVVLLAGGLWCSSVQADMLRMRDGSELRGTILTGGEGKGGPVALKKLSGEEVSIPSDEIRFVVKRPLVQEQYLERLEHAADTLNGQWELAEWCRLNGLRQERETHLQRVLDFDPQHAGAHRALEHVHYEGEWIPQDEMKTRQGYVKYQGKYMLPQDIELAERLQQLKEVHREWHRKVSAWQKGLSGDRPEEARAKLLAIRDPNAVQGLLLCFQNSPQQLQRELLVTILSKIPSQEAISGIVVQSLLDSKSEVRDFAFANLPAESKRDAVACYVRALKHPLNIVVNRAARSIYLLEGREAIPDLISALTTVHRVVETKTVATPATAAEAVDPSKPLVWDNNGAIPLGFGYGGGGVNFGGLSYGSAGFGALAQAGMQEGAYVFVNGDGYPRLAQIKKLENVTVTSRKPFRNPDVLAVLREFTRQDFGYDENGWRQWWRTQHPQSIITKP